MSFWGGEPLLVFRGCPTDKAETSSRALASSTYFEPCHGRFVCQAEHLQHVARDLAQLREAWIRVAVEVAFPAFEVEEARVQEPSTTGCPFRFRFERDGTTDCSLPRFAQAIYISLLTQYRTLFEELVITRARHMWALCSLNSFQGKMCK